MRRILLSTLLLAAACAGETEPPTLGLSPITNGTIATSSSHPYAVFLQLSSQSGDVYRCTGTLIGPDTVLTAAHCAVCTSSATAYVLGEGSANGPGTRPLVPHPSSSIAFNPAAYPDLPDCSLSGEDLFADLNAKTVWGADVAIIRLAAASAVTPRTVLLDPPYGFNPVQDLWGQRVTLVGRGLA
jgi:hypothetical protein